MTERQEIAVDRLIDDAPVGRFQIFVVTLCGLVSLLDGFDTQSLAFVAPLIAREWNLSQVPLGILFSATLLGAAIGAAGCGVLSDRLGRKALIVGTVIIFGLLTGACALVNDYRWLLALRFLGGVALGGTFPNLLAYVSEYMPARRRATVVTVVSWGVPAGAVVGGLVASPLIAAHGWRSVFVVGGIAPILLGIALIFVLPESVQLLASDPRHRSRVIDILGRIDAKRAGRVRMGDKEQRAAGSRGIAGLFAPGVAALTILLSLTLFLSLFLTFLLLNWVPVLLTNAGLSLSQAVAGAVAINAGGIAGSYVVSRVIDRHSRPVVVLAAGYILSGAVIALSGRASGSPALALTALTACGVFLIGPQLSLCAYAAVRFPVVLRGTGLGFMQFVGRTGSLIGPIVGGMLLSTGMTSRTLLELGCVPAALAGVALFALAAMEARGTRGERPPASNRAIRAGGSVDASAREDRIEPTTAAKTKGERQ